jgi:type II secretory pathway component PulF
MNYLDRPATIGDVIKWVVMIPAFTAVTVILPYLTMGVLPKFKTMYDSVYIGRGTEPPAISRFVMENYHGLYYTIFFVTVIGLLFALISRKSQVLNIVITSLCNFLLWTSIAAAFLAVWYITISAQYAT